jgi:hypothetical protein
MVSSNYGLFEPQQEGGQAASCFREDLVLLYSILLVWLVVQLGVVPIQWVATEGRAAEGGMLSAFSLVTLDECFV